MAKLRDDRLDKFRPQLRNANKHTQRGMGVLETSMRKYGYVAPMTAAADGEILDGSARIETSATVFGDDVLIVEHDGTKPVIMVRTDIASADTPEARAISIAANRVAELNLDYDPEVLLEDIAAGLDLSAMFRQDELDELLADLTPKDDELAGVDVVPQQWAIMIECSGETEQAELLQRFEAEGLKCRALIS